MNSEQLKRFLSAGNITVVEAMQKIDANSKGILFIVNEVCRLEGVVTDGDIRRWIIKTANLQQRVSEMMNKSPKYVCLKEIKTASEYMERMLINVLPVLDPAGKVVDVIVRDEDGSIKMPLPTKHLLNDVDVVIMAGGKGTRLYPYTKILPKPLIPIGDVPIMERIIGRFCDYGVNHFTATLNYRKTMIRSYFADLMTNYRMDYVEENKPLGTAGSLKLIQKSYEKPFIVTNCDILIEADYADIYKHHCESGNMLTIVTALKNIVVPYGVINAKENAIVDSMEEKPKISYFVNTGMYVLNPELLEWIPKDTFYHMTNLADDLLKQGKQVGMYPISEDSFLDMGEFEEMHRMEQKLNQKAE
jgi:Nucleoside-diphosphate-sugar pyrophosphorylase involved in lipopolysaccharide biosynthesis/translation initiation factor 2B, gamma/epsilon subunits (eIF-2Bgamma/eIF-2Bepsilon)